MLKSSPIFRNSCFRLSFSAFSCVPLIGLEIHAQLTSSRSKVFSPVQYAFAAPPNTQVHHFDAALPGSLPILNQNCFEWAIIAGLGLNCQINLLSKFDRKHYFYADSPAGFQITQHDLPVAEDGWLEYIWKAPELKSIPQVSKAKIRRIQLEQDTGKSLHDENSSRSLIDLNRAGVALIEIVTDPVFTMSCQAAAFVDELASLLRHLRVCASNMSTGEMRVDINVSVGPSVSQQGPIVEIKNVNSLSAIRHAIDYEIHRQRKIYQSGGKVINETRSFDMLSNKTISMRDKEVLQDYRFLPEPNLPPIRLLEFCKNCSKREYLQLKTVCIGCIRERHKTDLANLPIILRKELVFQHNLSPERAGCLIDHPTLLSLYISTSKFALNQSESVKNTVFAVQNIREEDFPHLIYRELSFWCTGQLYSSLRDKPDFCLPSDDLLSQFVIMNLTGDIFGTGSEQVLNEMCEARDSPSVLEIAERLGVLLNHDLCTIKSACSEFIENNSTLVEKYIRKGRKHRILLSMVRRIVLDHKDRKRLHEGLVERCLSDMLANIGMFFP